MARQDRWSRHVGTGIGLSGHKNQFRLGVCIENWVEDHATHTDSLAGLNTLMGGCGTPSPAEQFTSTAKASYTAVGKAGDELLSTYERRDYYENNGRFQNVPAPHILGHGRNPGAEYKATVSGLAFQEPKLEAKRLHTYLWSGSKANNYGVPENVDTMYPSRKMVNARLDMRHNREFAGASLAATASSGAEALELIKTAKRDKCAPTSVGGQAATSGRKVKGDFVGTFEKPHMNIGLRK